MSRVFGHGDLRLYLLKLLEEGPRHGYELIRLLEDRFLGMYSPSPGTVYPRLSALEEDGLVVSEEREGRKVYKLTDAGRSELAARSDEVREVGERVASSAKEVAKQIRDEVRSSVRDLRRDIRDTAKERARPVAAEVGEDVRRAMRDVGEEVRRVTRTVSRDLTRDIRGAVRDVRREERRVARDVGRDLKGSMRSLQLDLEAFVSDVIAAARRHHLDRGRVQALQDALLEAREIIIDALTGKPREEREPRPERVESVESSKDE